MIARRTNYKSSGEDFNTLSCRVQWSVSDLRRCLSHVAEDYKSLGLPLILREDLISVMRGYLFFFLTSSMQFEFATWAVDAAERNGLIEPTDKSKNKYKFTL